MILPAKNHGQRLRERARGEHEALYLAFMKREVVTVPVTTLTFEREQKRWIQKTKDFWGERGYRIRTKQSGPTELSVWLEAK